jgi:hypothetical protein
VAFSQDPLAKVKEQVPATTAAPKFDVKSLASGIMGKLGPTLALTAIQKPQMLSTVTDFLNKKSGIIGLATSDKAQYVAKLAGLNTGFLDKAKGILSATQYTSLLGLKPKVADATNPISQLFF